MTVREILKSQKGSSLVMVILIMITMSLLGISLITVTLSELDMSTFYSETNRAYFTAEAGVEQIARVLDQKVAAIQEAAKIYASDEVKLLLQDHPEAVRDANGTIDNEYVNSRFKAFYNIKFLNGLNTEFLDVGSLEKKRGLLNSTDTDLPYAYKDIADGSNPDDLEDLSDNGKVILEDAGFDSGRSEIVVTVKGVYKDYIKRLRVTFSLLPETEALPYNAVYKTKVYNKEFSERLPPVLKKAVVAEENIISAGGNVNVSGDVLCFGTVPSVEDEEDQSASWFEYGGILAGMCPEVESVSGKLGFDAQKTVNLSSGSIHIDGNAATLGYIHSLYGTRGSHSDITITGDAFARAVKAEKQANFARLELQNVYTMDNLQIDSSEAEVNVNGKFYGFVDAGYMIDGSGTGSSGDLSAEGLKPRRTSSIVVNGDSLLHLKGEVYVGGSTFLNQYVNGDGNPFMTGISALKSGKRIVNAFKENDSSNPGNTLFWFDEHSGTYLSPAPAPFYKSYSMVNLLDGKADEQGYFPMSKRAMHVKGIWEHLWKNDEVFSNYINTSNIRITGNGLTESGKLKGYSNGAIFANDLVYGINDFSSVHDPVEFHTVQSECIKKYHDAVQDLLNVNYSPTAPKLDYTGAAKKSIASYMDINRFMGPGKIEKNVLYTAPTAINKGFLYYGDTDVEIVKDGEEWKIGNEIIPVMKGIIYVDGDIYVRNGFTFTGILMASGNIVFLGDANITYDEQAVNDLLGADTLISGLFRLLSVEVPDETLQSQRIMQKNIKIVNWKEIGLD
ncbi:MAG: pilus assembly PilX N-terminal domain-containing protein [Clostridia bacterium]|nr:pilus assembly PilX N-terminal domain-containing protein [Clostridia bacterium]